MEEKDYFKILEETNKSYRNTLTQVIDSYKLMITRFAIIVVGVVVALCVSACMITSTYFKYTYDYNYSTTITNTNENKNENKTTIKEQ